MLPVRLVTALAIIFWTSSTFAQLYATPGNNLNGDTNLYIIDPSDGSILETIGPTGHYVTGLDFDPITGDLYGATTLNDIEPNPSSLIRIDPETGATTVIGQHSDCVMVDMSFNSDGTLFGWRECNDVLVTIDLSDGSDTMIGVDNYSTAGQSLDFAPDDRLYQFGESTDFAGGCNVVEMDATDGLAISEVSELSDCTPINGGSHNANGILYGSQVVVRGNDSSGERNLVIIDKDSGDVTILGTSLPFMSALAWRDGGDTKAVPSSTGLSVLLMVGMFALLGWRARKRLHFS